MNFNFSVFVLNDSDVLKVGSICLVDSCSFPFIISCIFKPSLGGSAFVSGVIVRVGKPFLFHIIFKRLLTAHLSIFVAVPSFVCQVCPVKPVALCFMVKLLFSYLKKEILQMFHI